MKTTLEFCSICHKPPCNRIVYRCGDLLICNRFCAKDSIGLVAWNAWFEQECKERMKEHCRSNVKQFKAK